MNSSILYQWTGEINKRFPTLGRWQCLTLALFSYGVILAQRCTLSRVAQCLTGRADGSSCERRLQRWLANERIEVKGLFAYWVRWVLHVWGEAPLLVLVDETKLSDHVAMMMVGLAYQASTIPLLWHAYHPADYPEAGQVALLSDLLAKLRPFIPANQVAILLADRGLGTSPAWQARLTELNWDYLLRVQRSTATTCSRCCMAVVFTRSVVFVI
jgi:hypothetical protein